ncbi:MAG: uncharacterized protein K0S11_1225 [Gammaproteobacteria bacterium]|jgi:DNA invertase Pin-like site-specific DNA recombinase|nr:uncharacterized protein [Gammaproteobacteria bacterium]
MGSLTTKLIEKKVGLISLNDAIDTTTAQDWLVFDIFAWLAEIANHPGSLSTDSLRLKF